MSQGEAISNIRVHIFDIGENALRTGVRALSRLAVDFLKAKC